MCLPKTQTITYNIGMNFPVRPSGLLLLDKPEGWTSHDVVAYTRGVTRVRQIGHTGTLDPFATGLLILLIGDATKKAVEFHKFSKMYEATIKLGLTTNTYDRTGVITSEAKDLQLIHRPVVEEKLMDFVGEIKQMPPAFSAKKIQGRKAYEMARAGQVVNLEPSTVTVEEIAIHNYEFPLLHAGITCSTGTYIRSLAHDLGQALGCGATLQELRRVAIGPYRVQDAIEPKQLRRNTWHERLKPVIQ
jgi:tRNA pseudouridine55 synthase